MPDDLPKLTTKQRRPLAGDRSRAGSQNFTKKERAAVLIAEDDLTDEAIADAVGVTRRTLGNWKNDPDFMAVVKENVDRIQATMLRLAIARKHKRLAVLDDLHTKALQVIDERTVVSGNGAPGESTGLVVRQIKSVGSGRDAELVEEYVVDVGLIREIRALHKQAAQELGQWSEKLEHTGKDGGPIELAMAERIRKMAEQYGTTEAEIVALASEDDE